VWHLCAPPRHGCLALPSGWCPTGPCLPPSSTRPSPWRAVRCSLREEAPVASESGCQGRPLRAPHGVGILGSCSWCDARSGSQKRGSSLMEICWVSGCPGSRLRSSTVSFGACVDRGGVHGRRHLSQCPQGQSPLAVPCIGCVSMCMLHTLHYIDQRLRYASTSRWGRIDQASEEYRAIRGFLGPQIAHTLSALEFLLKTPP